MALGRTVAIAARRDVERSIDLPIGNKSRPETDRLGLARRLLANPPVAAPGLSVNAKWVVASVQSSIREPRSSPSLESVHAPQRAQEEAT
jgi:hypothetical protein